MIIIPPHARKQMEKRGIDEVDVIETVRSCEIIFEQINERFGVKKYSKLPLGFKSLIVVWYVNKNGEEEVITTYWRRDRK
jgi:hypothetical protein